MFTTLFSEPLPPTINDLITQRDHFQGLFPSSTPSQWRVSRKPFSFGTKDSATASFYRIYQFVVLDRRIQLRNELEYFCTMHPEWAVERLPDPKDYQDLPRYAALAAVTQLMCDAFNRRIELGLPRDAPPIVQDWEGLSRRPKIFERVPAWAGGMDPLPEVVRIPNADGRCVADGDPEVSASFKRLNILLSQPHIHFV